MMKLFYEIKLEDRSYIIHIKIINGLEKFIDFLAKHGALLPEIEELIGLADKNFLKRFKSIYFVYIIKNLKTGREDILGFLGLDIPIDKNKNVFIDIYVYPECRRYGIAYTIIHENLEYICKYIKETLNKSSIHATVNMDNLASIRLLEKLGFIKLPDKILEDLRRRGVLGNNELRFIYYCKLNQKGVFNEH